MRVTACVRNVLTFAPLLRSQLADEMKRQDLFTEQQDSWARTDRMRAPARWNSHGSFQFAATLQGMYYFVRSLQDAVYRALLEANGQRAGDHTSMGDCAKNRDSLLHPVIDTGLPGYFDWFGEMRDLRNQMKIGLSNSFHVEGQPVKQVHLTVQTIDDEQRHVGLGRGISMADIDECLEQSARLLDWSASHVSRAQAHGG
jgi:hypothetical protein